MKRLAWLTDIHLNFLRQAGLRAFFASLPEADAFAITGDIGEAHDVAATCGRSRSWGRSTSSSATTTSTGARSRASGPKSASSCREVPNLQWMPDAGVDPAHRDHLPGRP